MNSVNITFSIDNKDDQTQSMDAFININSICQQLLSITQMKTPTITVTTSETTYYLTQDEFQRATQNGFLDRLGLEVILTVEEELKVNWKRVGF